MKNKVLFLFSLFICFTSFVKAQRQVTFTGKSYQVTLFYTEDLSENLYNILLKISDLSDQYNKMGNTSVKSLLISNINEYTDSLKKARNELSDIDCPQINELFNVYDELIYLYPSVLKGVCLNTMPIDAITTSINNLKLKQNQLNSLVINCMHSLVNNYENSDNDNSTNAMTNNQVADAYTNLGNTIDNNLNQIQQQQDYINQTNPDYLDDNYDANITYNQNNANSVNNDDVASNVVGSNININKYNSSNLEDDNSGGWEDDNSGGWDPMQTVDENGGAEEIEDDNSNWENNESIGWEETNQEIIDNNIAPVQADNQDIIAVETQNSDELQAKISDKTDNANVDDINNYGNNLQNKNVETYNNFNQKFSNNTDNISNNDENNNDESSEVAVSVSNTEKSYYEEAKDYFSGKWNTAKKYIPKGKFGLPDLTNKVFNFFGNSIDVGANPNSTEEDYKNSDNQYEKIKAKAEYDNGAFIIE